MALGNNHVTTTTAATFIPEIWTGKILEKILMDNSPCLG